MQKRGQVFSGDMVMGFVIFLLVTGFFYNYVTSIQAKKFQDVSLKFQSSFVFNSVMLGLDMYMSPTPTPSPDVDFFGNNSYRVDATKLDDFDTLPYCNNPQGPFCQGNDKKTIVLGSLLDSPNFKNMDFCMYFVDKDDKVKMHIGPDNNDILIDDTTGSTEKCGVLSPQTGFKPNPLCKTKPYTHSIKVMRLVVWDVSGKDEIVTMHILICGEQIE